jgi:ubiquitin-activating enzyme E1-like protein 2
LTRAQACLPRLQ